MRTQNGTMVSIASNMTNIAVAEIQTEGQSGGRFVAVGKGDSGFDVHGQRGCSPPLRVERRPSDLTLLNMVNQIFRTNCKDADAIDATATWGVIVEEIMPYDDVVPIFTLRFQRGMTLKEAARILGLPLARASSRCQMAMAKLRHPCRILRIRNSIIGWPNLYRDV
jgi:hypothetical protein